MNQNWSRLLELFVVLFASVFSLLRRVFYRVLSRIVSISRDLFDLASVGLYIAVVVIVLGCVILYSFDLWVTMSKPQTSFIYDLRDLPDSVDLYECVEDILSSSFPLYYPSRIVRWRFGNSTFFTLPSPTNSKSGNGCCSKVKVATDDTVANVVAVANAVTKVKVEVAAAAAAADATINTTVNYNPSSVKSNITSSVNCNVVSIQESNQESKCVSTTINVYPLDSDSDSDVEFYSSLDRDRYRDIGLSSVNGSPTICLFGLNFQFNPNRECFELVVADLEPKDVLSICTNYLTELNSINTKGYVTGQGIKRSMRFLKQLAVFLGSYYDMRGSRLGTNQNTFTL